MKNNTRTLRAATQATVIALAFATASIGAPAAFADEPEPETNTPAAAPVSSLDADHDVTFTIHKRVNADTLGKRDGTANNGVGGEPLKGVHFTIQKINRDITKQSEFNKVAGMTPEVAADNVTGPAIEKTTNDNGVATWTKADGIGVGAYLVTETTAPKGVSKARPFIVFLPMTNPEGSGWNYDVVAYPKNSKIEASKSLADEKAQRANAGDTFDYQIDTARPTADTAKNNQYISYFAVEDTLPEEVVLADGTTAEKKVRVTVGDTDYTIDDDFKVQKEGAKVTVVFTNAGLKKLMAAAPDSKVKVLIPVTVQKVGATDGKAFNTASVVFDVKDITDPANPDSDDDNPKNPGKDDGDVPTKPEDPGTGTTNEVPARWANLVIKKVGEDDKVLPGATFNVYRCTDASSLIGEKLTIDGKDAWTTNDQGVATVESVRVPDNQEGGGVDFKYCLVETQAPEGYELLVNPVVVEMTATSVDKDEDKTSQEAEVVNLKSTSSKLPSTGGAGVGLLMALGASILGLGAFAAKRASRKSQ
ncbi:SpaH/EbpB family LPXTG-anchored major pilin [Corynebacterium sp. P5875]|uniref:SpaH/EbpB family LPXTG-anchored major pilin n=1 Tax=Corynebacterium antarcticum TaxID=2800405 RepID=A0A9Q4GKC7_9CORY|nr:SpaH/EbpB family LPXTG-anchored major pilin [Corynebacterium antarcticum]MCX7492011.1 SpaH/EbpB family LPXTG-anchored major pilin [Corynebacterium antarcticum]MCX7537940.1 SpaH/EbpB family LPXTG-anchored major pilin [Corynebacterium antarcticum]